MGGRGASSGTSKAGNPYGSQYRSLLTVGNVKFVQKNTPQSETLMETMTRGRVYAVIDGSGEVKSIVYFDNDNKRSKQIDITKSHAGMKPHTHHGYEHNELDSAKGAANLTTEERKMVERVLELWENNRDRS